MRRILCFSAAVLLCACSVKENRSLCPCELLVRSVDPLKTDGDVLISVIQDGEVVKQGMMSREDFESGRCSMTVPRRPSTVTVFTGITNMSAVSGRRLDIRYDHQCDALYSSSDFAALDADSYDCVVTPHKNYDRLNLTVVGMPEGAKVDILGNVQGYDLMSLDPCSGSFCCSPENDGIEDGIASYKIRLPRQLDDGLTLNLCVDGNIFRSVPIGLMIADSGYCYDDTDLLDISLTVDLSNSYGFVTVADWETELYPLVEY